MTKSYFGDLTHTHTNMAFPSQDFHNPQEYGYFLGIAKQQWKSQ